MVNMFAIMCHGSDVYFSILLRSSFFFVALSGFAYLLTQPTQDSVTYRVSPNEWKVFGNAINKFMQAGISNFISMALYKRCASWFNPNNGNDTINGITNYTAASSWKFIYVLGAFPAFQTIFCLLPWVDRWYQKIEEYVHKNDESHNE
jgi:arginine exporter protein ArgO